MNGDQSILAFIECWSYALSQPFKALFMAFFFRELQGTFIEPASCRERACCSTSKVQDYFRRCTAGHKPSFFFSCTLTPSLTTLCQAVTHPHAPDSRVSTLPLTIRLCLLLPSPPACSTVTTLPDHAYPSCSIRQQTITLTSFFYLKNRLGQARLG